MITKIFTCDFCKQVIKGEWAGELPIYFEFHMVKVMPSELGVRRFDGGVCETCHANIMGLMTIEEK